MDLNRVKFLLRAYLRTRLVKVGAARTSLSRSPVHAGPQIEEHVFHYLSGEHNLLQRLSPHELAFAQGCGHSLSQAGIQNSALRFRYTDAVDSHFVASVLHALPKQYESILKQIDDGDDENRSSKVGSPSG